jgi:hypothetical protein
VTDRYTGEPTPTEEGVARWIHLDEVARLRPLLPNTAEIVRASVRLLRTG